MRFVLVNARLPLRAKLLAGTAVAYLALTPHAHAQIVNGSFETGDFTGYTRGAFFVTPNTVPSNATPGFGAYRTAFQAGPTTADENAVVTVQNTAFNGFGTPGPDVNPTNGARLAFISNQISVDDAQLTGSHIFQTFTVSSSATANSARLVFDVALLNNDSDDTDIANFNDFGGFALVQGSGLGGTILADYVIDRNSNSSANAHLTLGSLNSAASVGGFINSTPFNTGIFSLSGLDSQTVTLVAYSTNAGDDTIESRLLLDNIQVQSGIIPEPASISLAALALVATGIIRRRRRHSR